VRRENVSTSYPPSNLSSIITKKKEGKKGIRGSRGKGEEEGKGSTESDRRRFKIFILSLYHREKKKKRK